MKKYGIHVFWLIVCCAVYVIGGSPQIQPGTDVKLTIERTADRISVRNQDGRGLLFYRGLDEVQEYLQSKPTDQWEVDLQAALTAQVKADPTLKAAKDQTYTISDAVVTKK